MSRRSIFTHITPLPPNVTRESAVEWLHNHKEMIELNPLVLRHQRCEPHDSAPQEEHACNWYEMTDEINYLPGGLMKGEVTYKAAFHNLPQGLQTHVYAPAGLDLREKWTVCGNMPGEPKEPKEMGSGIPSEGLYIREDVDMRCNVFLTGFVKKNLSKSHKVVVEKVAEKAAADARDRAQRQSVQAQQYTVPEPQQLSVTAQDDLQMELPACQCSEGHEPTCSMYVDPTHGRFVDFQINEQKASTSRQVKRIPYEPFNYVKLPSTNPSSPELFSGNFHPLSHYHLLLGNKQDQEAEEEGTPFVQTTKVSLVRAELPATPSRAATS